jgi:hypothetical protein
VWRSFRRDFHWSTQLLLAFIERLDCWQVVADVHKVLVVAELFVKFVLPLDVDDIVFDFDEVRR